MNSDSAERRIAELEGELVAVQEILFGVLMTIGEPVVVDVEDLRDMIKGQDHMIDASLNEEEKALTCQIFRISERANT